MKRIMILIMFASALMLAACGNAENDKIENSKGTENTKKEQNVQSDDDTSEETGTSTDSSVEQGDSEGDVKIHVMKADKDAGATVENHPLYSAVADYARKHPNLGTKDDYSVNVVDATQPKDGEAKLLLLGVNGFSKPIGEISFRITIGDKKGHTVLDNRKVEIPADAMGALPSGYGHPILIPITEEELSNLNELDPDTQFVDMKDTKVSKAE